MEVDPSTSSGPPKTPKHDLMMEEGRAKSVFFKQAKSFPMFPFREEKLKWDEYGEPIRYVWVRGCVCVYVCGWMDGWVGGRVCEFVGSFGVREKGCEQAIMQ